MKRERKMIRVEEIFQYADQMERNFNRCVSTGDDRDLDRYCEMYTTAVDIMHYLGIHDQYIEYCSCHCADTLD